MPQLLATVASQSGLHARPASLFVQTAVKQPVRITVGRPGEPGVDARSLLSVLALAARHGETLELTADGDQAQAALEELAELLATDLDSA